MNENCKNCEEKQACIPFFIHENAMMHKDMDNERMEKIDCLFHALKSGETYYAMQEAGEMGFSGNYGGGNYGGSYARGRDSRGRYMSREMSREGGYSGHYPMPMYGYSGEYERW